ncbi:XRE family transcriptional regulator [Pararobbsia alpina]|uniref:helix-turn-helix domain-containing protein n=1 Tax=Pararobbsia alpina TaxID=621374 RepID=UPI0039A77F77
MTTLVHQIGRRVRALREARQWSQEQLAERAGLNRSYIGEVERGSVIASVVTVDKIAHALSLSLPELLNVAPLPGPAQGKPPAAALANDA